MQTATVSDEIQLAARPRGVPGPESFSWAERPVRDPDPGEVIVADTHNIGKMVVRLGDAR